MVLQLVLCLMIAIATSRKDVEGMATQGYWNAG